MVFKERMYSFLRINIGFNLFLIIRSFLSMMSDCVEINSIYCSETRTFPIIQNVKIYLVNYFGSASRICSSVTSLAFSFDRYILNKTKKGRFGDLFSKFKINFFLAILILISLLISLPKIFKYKIVNEEIVVYHNSYPELRQLFANSDDNWISFCDLIIEVVNDFIILTLNAIVDILLLKQLPKILLSNLI